MKTKRFVSVDLLSHRDTALESSRAWTGPGRYRGRPVFAATVLATLLILVTATSIRAETSDTGPDFHAGAAAVNIDPPDLPAITNGGFSLRRASKVTQSLYARSLVLQSGDERVALCVVDTCMMDRQLCDQAKTIVARETSIPENRILISATHTHSAPAAMRALGCPADPKYPSFLTAKVAQSIKLALDNLQPAQAGWGVADAGHYTNTRRWIYLPNKMPTDPYGQISVRAMMHPGHNNPNTAGPAGPKDPDLTVLSVRDREGNPLAVFGNFSMHYFGSSGLSSDFTGRVCQNLETKRGTQKNPHFVALMSQGTSGDLHFMDYSRSQKDDPFHGKPDGFQRYCQELAQLVLNTEKNIAYRSHLTLAMAEEKLLLRRRLPDENRLAWAKRVRDGAITTGGVRAKVLADEVFWIRDNPEQEIKLQAIRVGEFGITAMPNEVYGITGLKLKLQSPLQPTMNIELANGASGYIPPPEQHYLGGYTTWPARTAGLEVDAEPKIVATILGLLEDISGTPRRTPKRTLGSYAERTLAAKPCAYWSMDPHSGDRVVDVSGSGHDAQLEPGCALFLPGPGGDAFITTERGNRAVQFAGGRMDAKLPDLGARYTVSFWFYNAMPHNGRPVTGYLFSRGEDGSSEGDHLGIGGNAASRGKLIFYNGDTKRELLAGTTELELKTWYHVAMVRDGSHVRVYLDGDLEPEIDAAATITRPENSLVYVGGRSDGRFNFEGKIDEVAVFDRVLPTRGIPTPPVPIGTVRNARSER